MVIQGCAHGGPRRHLYRLSTRPGWALAATARRAAARGASLHVVCARSRIRRLFGLTGLDRAVPLAERLGEALPDTAGAEAAAV